jgi:hypothetical protein
VVAALASFGGCRAETLTSDSGLLVAMTANRGTASPTAPVQFTITLTNVGTTALEVPAPQSYGCSPSYQVLDAADRVLTLPTRFCALAVYAPVILRPGEQMMLTDAWAADEGTGTGTRVAVPPGVYRVRAMIAPTGRLLTSAPVSVTVTP